jgi:hypothetical protein
MTEVKKGQLAIDFVWKTFDPAIWGVAEGKTEKGTANVIEE